MHVKGRALGVVGNGEVTLGVIENSGQSASWQLNGGGAGQISGHLQNGFTGVDHRCVGSADTPYGSATDTGWSANGAGSVQSTPFGGFTI